MNSIICPVSKEKIDNYESRITVFISVIFMAAFIYTRHPAYMVLATTDTLIRAIFFARYSPMRMIASRIRRFFNGDAKKIGLAKKVFAARLGMLCGIISIALFYFNLEWASLAIAGFWMLLAILDSLFDFCLGCVIYTYLILPFHINK
ncbi:DUF4395 domain-containing protein [Fulvivirgaceae bacterium BMA12]|uniref:DUF4395 domain-containing protein n=1 Tax=Agaribacillus aureus TaxID=3051825 RepID=A0ABT8L5I1_9BACT|nr:DUF4395 domain-containing protein [Fulvivirgaceae bacterium BMA12]